MQAIAEAVGVSRASVSLVLTNKPEILARFKPETVTRIRQAAGELGYRANIMALNLSHPSFFGLILRGSGVADAISWHHQAFEGQFLTGVLEASRLLGLYPVLATQDSPDPEAALARAFGILEGGVFGAVARTPCQTLEEHLHSQIGRGLPVVIVFPEDSAKCPSNSIDVDNVTAGRLAGRILVEAGRRRLLLIEDDTDWEAVRLRRAGFMDIRSDGIAKVDVLTVPAGTDVEATETLVANSLKEIRPDGIYTTSSVTGIETLMACQKAGLSVPGETALVGSDVAVWKTSGYPSLTSVDVSWHEVGELAVRKMVELQESDDRVFSNVRLPPRIHLGGTCPVNPELVAAQA